MTQCSPIHYNLHRCMFFSKQFSSAEKNYYVRDRELVAIKLALEHWQHWLESTELLVTVWTDHNDPAYIQSVKRLNPRQYRR